MELGSKSALLRAVSLILIFSFSAIIKHTDCLAEKHGPEITYPDILDPETLFCEDSSSVTIDQWQPGGESQYQTDLRSAEAAALAACNAGLAKVKRKLKNGDNSVLRLPSDKPITNPEDAKIGSIFEKEMAAGWHTYKAQATIVCDKCKTTYLRVEKKFGCGFDPADYTFRELLDHHIDWRSFQQSIIANSSGNAYQQVYCWPYKEEEKLNATVDARQLCDLPCEGQCTNKYYASKVKLKTTYQFCYFGENELSSQPRTKLPVRYNGADFNSTEQYWFTLNEDAESYACEPFVPSPDNGEQQVSLTNMCSFSDLFGGMASSSDVYEELAQIFANELVKPVLLFSVER